MVGPKTPHQRISVGFKGQMSQEILESFEKSPWIYRLNFEDYYQMNDVEDDL